MHSLSSSLETILDTCKSIINKRTTAFFSARLEEKHNKSSNREKSQECEWFIAGWSGINDDMINGCTAGRFSANVSSIHDSAPSFMTCVIVWVLSIKNEKHALAILLQALSWVVPNLWYLDLQKLLIVKECIETLIDYLGVYHVLVTVHNYIGDCYHVPGQEVRTPSLFPSPCSHILQIKRFLVKRFSSLLIVMVIKCTPFFSQPRIALVVQQQVLKVLASNGVLLMFFGLYCSKMHASIETASCRNRAVMKAFVPPSCRFSALLI